MKEIIKLHTKKFGWLEFENEKQMLKFLAKETRRTVKEFKIKGNYVYLKGTNKRNYFTKEKVIEGREWVVKTLASKGYVCYKIAEGEDGSLWKLSVRVPMEVWLKIKHFFWYVNDEDDAEGFTDFWIFERVRGWVTDYNSVDEIAKILYEEAKKVATELEKQEAEELRRENEEFFKKLEEEERKRKEEEERKERENKEKERKAKEILEKIKQQLRKIKTSDCLDWDWLKKRGCKHKELEFKDLEEIFHETWGSNELEVRYDECTNTTIVFVKVFDSWWWEYYEGKISIHPKQ